MSKLGWYVPTILQNFYRSQSGKQTIEVTNLIHIIAKIYSVKVDSEVFTLQLRFDDNDLMILMIKF